METAGILVGILFLAGFIEWTVERFLGTYMSGFWIKVAAGVVGLALALVFKLGLIASVGIAGIDMTSTVAKYADYVITGIVMGAGSNAVHDLFGKYLSKE